MFILQRFLIGSRRSITASPLCQNKLTRQPKGPEYYEQDHVTTASVSVIEGMPLPTAVQWMKRRGPALQKHKISRLFRTRHIRFLDPETNLVHRARRDRILQPGSRLFVPKFALGTDVQKLSEKTLKTRKRDPASLEIWEDLKRRILFSAPDFHILNKPTRLVVQGDKKVSLASLVKSGLTFGDKDDTKMVHRLDKNTSGAMIVARSKDAAAWISKAFVEHSRKAKDPSYKGIPGLSVDKAYWAVVENYARPEVQGIIDAMVVSEDKGEPFSIPAVTEYKVMGQENNLTWLELKPITGKKHQLRVHCSQYLKSPIKGDIRYGATASTEQPGVGDDRSAHLRSQIPKIHLHSRAIEVRCPGKADCQVVAPLPPHMQRLFEAQGWQVKQPNIKDKGESRVKEEDSQNDVDSNLRELQEHI